MSLENEFKYAVKEIHLELNEIKKMNTQILKMLSNLDKHNESTFEKILGFGAEATSIAMLKEILNILKQGKL